MLAPLALLCTFTLGACATIAVDENDPSTLFKSAEDEIRSDHFILAAEKLRSIRNKFPYSQFAPLAQLRLADVYFLQESFGESAVAYETFRDLYPQHDRSAFALFRIAKSYFRDTPSQVARDLASASRAAEAYRVFLRKYPTDPLHDEAAQDLATAEDLLAKKEKEIANFYSKNGQNKAARTRLEKLVNLYPKTPTAAEARQELERTSSP
jgi:outer membrane protein assembly factor BamD